MPIVIRKLANKNLYSVKNSLTKEIHAKATTKTKAQAQKRIIDSIDKKK